MGKPESFLLICDLDGTLADTAPGICDALNHVLAQHGLPEFESQFIEKNIGGGAKALVRNALGRAHADKSASVLASFSAYYEDHAEQGTMLYPGVEDTLQEMHGSVRLAIATAKTRVATDRILQATGISDLFDCVVTLSEMTKPKPDPQCVVAIAAQMGADTTANNAALVGDTAIDMQTARNAGIAAWAVGYGYGVMSDYDVLVDSFADVKMLIPKITT